MRKRSFYRESRCSDHPGTGQSVPQTGRSRNARRDRLRGPLSPRRERRDDHHSRRTRSARHGNRPGACDGGHTVPRGRAAVQRPLQRDDHRRRGRVRHLAGPGRDPLARGRAPATAGASSATSATSATARPGRPATSRSAGRPTSTRSCSTPTGPSSAAATATVETRLAVCVSPDHDAEVRLVTLVNHGDRPRELELTSYAEVCLNHRRADQAHPAFAQAVPGDGVRRRSGRPALPPAARGPRTRSRSGPSTSRRRTAAVRVRDRPRAVPGPRPDARRPRGAGPRRAACPGRPARCSTRSSACGGGSASPRGPTASVAFVTGAADTREEALALAEQFRDLAAAERAFDWPGTAAGTSCGTWA